MQYRCSELEQEKLTSEVTTEEVKAVLFKKSNNNSPGPDGYTTEVVYCGLANHWEGFCNGSIVFFRKVS